jgi:2-polyprenyl-3-methyl-5-hydroxy-6-metoxy-1,4-benzoquinol methylase
MEGPYVQRDQPRGVPPLRLTGERTLPDVPAENYWYRRHLAVYEWIAAQVGGSGVTDLACGEGYGAEVLAASAADVIGVDANPEAHAHAAARYRRGNLRFERDLVENIAGPRDAIVFLQTIEHIADPGPLLEPHFRAVEIVGLHHAGKLRLHGWALKLGWDRLHRALGLTDAFYDRFTPAISAGDFSLRPGGLQGALDFVAVCRR